jgi:predicted GNAT superfamily acetyltransferase
MSDSDITIRECVSIEDFNQCIELERAVWKDDDIDIMPIRLYMISKACKAPTIGAFDSSGGLVGFVHTMLALAGRNVVYHSHMAAVLEDMRHRDIGYRIKLFQRRMAIEAGVPLIIWTFDPLQSRNAHFNINKLGAVIRRYEENYYGEGASTVFDPGVPSDRIFAEWWVMSPHVESVLAGARPSFEEDDSIVIPYDVNSIRENSIDEHLRWRLRARHQFQDKLGRGPIIRGFVSNGDLCESRYILGPDEEQFDFAAYQEVSVAV